MPTYRGICDDVSWENRRIDNMEVLSAIDLGIRIRDCGSALERAVGTHLRGPEPMVRAAFSRCEWDLRNECQSIYSYHQENGKADCSTHRSDKVLCAYAGCRNLPCNFRDLRNGAL